MWAFLLLSFLPILCRHYSNLLKMDPRPKKRQKKRVSVVFACSKSFVLPKSIVIFEIVLCCSVCTCGKRDSSIGRPQNGKFRGPLLDSMCRSISVVLAYSKSSVLPKSIIIFATMPWFVGGDAAAEVRVIFALPGLRA